MKRTWTLEPWSFRSGIRTGTTLRSVHSLRPDKGRRRTSASEVGPLRQWNEAMVRARATVRWAT